jgi:hypothetical protein
VPNRFDDACVSTVALAEVYKPLVKDRHGWAVPERMARACDAEAGLAFDE